LKIDPWSIQRYWHCVLARRYPERFAQEALGHNSKAAHRAYAKRALMKIPSLEACEEQAATKPTPPA
jgi:hypothetical protein